MEARYRIEKTELGWSVIDAETRLPAKVQGVPRRGYRSRMRMTWLIC